MMIALQRVWSRWYMEILSGLFSLTMGSVLFTVSVAVGEPLWLSWLQGCGSALYCFIHLECRD